MNGLVHFYKLRYNQFARICEVLRRRSRTKHNRCQHIRLQVTLRSTSDVTGARVFSVALCTDGVKRATWFDMASCPVGKGHVPTCAVESHHMVRTVRMSASVWQSHYAFPIGLDLPMNG